MECADIDEVRMICNGCGGQQKNAIFAPMCVEAVTKHPSIQQIDHKFSKLSQLNGMRLHAFRN